jgi:hypothetical protein
MPRPLYIVCSESGSEDKETGVLSLYNVIDKLQINKGPPSSKITNAPLTQIRITSVWMQEDGDDEREFEFEVVFRPPHEQTSKVAHGTFSFTMPLFRMTVKIFGLPYIKGDGIFWIESRVRKVGTLGWKLQEYPIFIEQLPAAAVEENKPAPQNLPG